MPTKPLNHKIARCIFLLLLALYLLTTPLRVDSGDGETMVHVACGLAAGRGVAVPVDPAELVDGRTGYGQVGRDGRYYSKYGLGWSLAAAPLCALGRAVAPLIPGATEGYVARVFVLLLNPLLAAAAGALLFRLAHRFYPAHLAATLALLYGLGTIAWYHATSAFSEPLAILLLVAAAYWIEEGRLAPAGFALGGTLLTRQTAILLAAPVAAWALLRGPRGGARGLLGRAARLLLPAALGQAAALAYNAYRFGSPLVTGYEWVTWDTPLPVGLYNQLLGPGKGLFVFNPLLLLGAAGWPALLRRRRDRGWLVLALFLCLLLPHAVYVEWTGGGGWGPRLLLPVIPFVLLPAGELLPRLRAGRAGRLLVALLVVVSLLVQVLGVSINWARHLQRVAATSASQEEYFYRVHYRWAESPIPGQLRSLLESAALLRDPAAREQLRDLVSPAVGLPLRDWQSEAVGLLSFHVPDLWFVYFWFLGAPTGWLIAAALALAAAAGGAALGLRRALAEVRDGVG